MHFKTLSRLLFAFYLCFSLNSLSAQPPQFQQQLKNITFNNEMRMQNQMMMQMMNMRGATGTGYFNFVVMLRDSSKLKVRSAMFIDSITKKRFIVMIDKKYAKSDTNRYKKIFPSQTLYLKRDVNKEDGSNVDLYYRGKPNDTCWMFKVITGSITAYSYLSDQDFMSFETSSLIGIQLNDGPIVRYSEDNLKQMITSDNAAMEYFQKKQYIKAIRKFNHNTEKK
jgi:hypothetical protein